MLKVNNLSYWHLQKDLYKEISFSLEEGEHCAFIGINGSGKSTLIDLIMNYENYSYNGDIELDKEAIIGYISQFSNMEKIKDLTVFQYIAQEYLTLQKELENICIEMETSSEIEKLLEEYQKVSDEIDALGGVDFEQNISKNMNLANLENYKELLISELSSGEFKLVKIIKEMLRTPDLLIMDEPDAFLDFENLNSLRNLINSYKGTLLVVTHNRYLLNNCFNKILHLENMLVQEFDGKYIDYKFSLLESKIELQELSIKDEEEIERNEVILRKYQKRASLNPEAAIGKYATSRAKIIERLEDRKIKAPFVYIKEPEINLYTEDEIEDEIALEVKDLNIVFDETLLENISFNIGSKEKVAIVGANGTGKTSLLRKLYKNNDSSIKYNEKIKFEYLSQAQGEILDEDNTVFEELAQTHFGTREDVVDNIKRYNFTEEFLEQKISSLSGGEKNLIQVIKMDFSNSNMLLLDEPTSHLDTYSQIALEHAVEKYNGAVLIVSHDLYFIINTMDYVFLIEDKSIRKINMKKFKRLVYSKYFERETMELEEKKKLSETKIEKALQDNNFELAQVLAEELSEIIKLI